MTTGRIRTLFVALALCLGLSSLALAAGNGQGNPTFDSLHLNTPLGVASGGTGASSLGLNVPQALANAINTSSGIPIVASPIVTGNCLQWGPGIQDAGAACNTGGGGGAVNSVSSSNGTLTISPTIGAVVASLNLANPNTWTGAQTFNAGLTGTLTGGASLDLPLSALGSNVQTALGNAINAANGLPNVDGSIVTGNCLKWGPGIQDAGSTCGGGGGGAVSSVSNSDGSLTISPTTGAIVASLALGHANTWTGLQTFASNELASAGITGSTQCVQANSAGVFSGTGGPCGGGGGGAVNSVSNSDGSLTISPTSGAVVSSLNLGHANTWTGVQTLNSPILTTPNLGTPSALTLTNATGLPNAGMLNSSITLGSTNVALGATATTLAGLSSVTSTAFTGSLTGAASLDCLITSCKYVYNVLDFGFAPAGQDNSPLVAALMAGLGTPNSASGGPTVVFPPIFGQTFTSYYFSKSLVLSTGINIQCGDGVSTNNNVNLVFAAGVSGVIQEDSKYTPTGGAGTGSVQGCGILSAGTSNGATATPGSTTVTGAVVRKGDPNSQTPASNWAIGDGVLIVEHQNNNPVTLLPIVPMGTTVTGVSGGTTITLSNPVSAQFAAADANFNETGTNNFIAGDALVIGNNTYTFRVTASAAGDVKIGTNFVGSGVNLAAAINGTTCVGCYVAPPNTPNITADVPYTTNLKFWAKTGGTAGNSIGSTYTPAGTSAGTFAQALFAGGAANGSVVVTQLPGPNSVSPTSSQQFTVQTIVGSLFVLVTGGPRSLSPGEWIASDAFPIGTGILQVRGAVQFTETGSNNFNVGDSWTNNNSIGNNTYHFVSSLVNPGDVLVGSTFAASAANLAAAIGDATSATRKGTATSFTGTIAGNTLTVSGVTGTLWFGQTVSGAGVTDATIISGSGTTWTIDGSPQTIGPVAMTGALNWITSAATQNAGASIGAATVPPQSAGVITLVGFQTAPFNGGGNTAVYTPSGTPAGAFDHATFADQMLTMDNSFQSGSGQNASVTHTAGSPGALWSIPTGLKRDVAAQSKHVSISTWPIGFLMACSGVFLNATNCTFSGDYDNLYESNDFGRVDAGNNTSGSISVNESFAKEYVVDVADLGTLSVTYVNVNAHSPESGGSNVGVLLNCININASFSVGGYVGLSTLYGQYPGCAAAVGLLPATPGGMFFINPADSTPFGAAVMSGSNLTGNFRDLSGQNNQNCVEIGSSTYSFAFGTAACTNSGIKWNLAWNQTPGSWDMGLSAGAPILVERFLSNAAGLSFTGYSAGGSTIEFPGGALLWNYENNTSSTNNARDIAVSAAAPTGTWHLEGDFAFNAGAVPGGNLGWLDAPSFTTTLAGAVTKGTTTSVAVAACPAIALPAGVAVVNKTSTPHVLLGTQASCTATTLTFQAVAANNGSSGNSIEFLQWYKGGLISNNFSIPDYSMQVVRSGTASNTDLTGRITLVGGAATFTLVGLYASAPNCITADVTAPANPNSVSESTTVLTFAGTGTDVLKYVCAGRN